MTRVETPPVVRLSGVHKQFGQSQVLKGMDLEVARGSATAILGGSGSGKSVVLKLLMGLLRPERGQVWVFGTDAGRLGEEGWRPLRRRSGMLFQGGALFDSLSVAENVAFPLRERRTPPERVRQVVEERLSWVGLSGIGGRRPSELSGGMRKRVALARTIATDPELILYDEPTTGLDPLTGRKISELIREIDDRLGSTSIVVTHDLGCASIVADRWSFISDGRILVEGSPAELRRAGPPEFREFLEAGAGPGDQDWASREKASREKASREKVSPEAKEG